MNGLWRCVRPAGVLVVIVLCALFLLRPAVAANGLTITAVQTNVEPWYPFGDVYMTGEVPQYEKFEISFEIENSVATNFQLPYVDASAAPPMPPEYDHITNAGISVDALFSPDGWVTVYRQPAFYYQDFEHDPSDDWIYPTDTFVWMVRFAPDEPGEWAYKLRARDGSGEVETPAYPFRVTAPLPGNHGFLGVSPDDSRYFVFEEGPTYFPGLGYNLNYNLVDWVKPVLNNESTFAAMAQNDIQLVRIWLSEWSIYSSAWNPWQGHRGIRVDGSEHLRETGLVPEFISAGEFSLRLQSAEDETFWDACYAIGSMADPESFAVAVKPQTTYQVAITYRSWWLSGPRNPGQPYGFMARIGGDCFGGGEVVTPYVTTNTGDTTTVLTGSWSSNDARYMRLNLVLANLNDDAEVYVDEVSVREDYGDGTYGPNILPKHSMGHHLYFAQRNSYAFDRVLDLAAAYDIYLKLVTLEKNERILNGIAADGVPTDPGVTPNENDQFYSMPGTKVRWLQQAWWRYLQARWGYSTHIHSWELLNEGHYDTNTLHFAQADDFGKFMHCEVFGEAVSTARGATCANTYPNAHMVTTSFYDPGSWPVSDFWTNPDYPNVSYADVHRYVEEGTSPYFDDAALESVDASGSYGNIGKPVMRGEVGWNFIDNDPTDLFGQNASDGVWLHNLIWAGVHAGGVLESYWVGAPLEAHIYTASGHDHRDRYGAYGRFMRDIPLQNGSYGDAMPAASAGLRAWGQRDGTTGHTHLWIQNELHTWRHVVDGVWDPVSSAVDGSVTVSGYSPGQAYVVEWWDTQSGLPVSSEVVTAVGGEIQLLVDDLATDTAVQIMPTLDLNLQLVFSCPTPSGIGFQLTLGPTSTGRQYEFQYKNSLLNGIWLVATVVEGSEGTTVWTDCGGPGRDLGQQTVFYRAAEARDPDRDGLSSYFETTILGTCAASDPFDADSDDDGTLDGAEDADGDGLTNEAEYNSPLLSGYLPGRGSSHPCLGDTDGDLAVDALGGDGFPLDYHAWYDNDADALADQPVLASMSQPPIAEDAQFTLAISLVGTGQGTVLAAAETYTGTATTTCMADCSRPYYDNTVVNLAATAVSGSVFVGWSGAGCGGTGACQVDMTADQAVTAMFVSASLVVNSTADGGDAVPGNGACDAGGGVCTLRAAIEEANALPGMDAITFAIPGAGPHTIRPAAPLPPIVDAVSIDGYTQPGAQPNSNAMSAGSNGVLLIELDGSLLSAGAGLTGQAPGTVIRGLAVNRFADEGIRLLGGGTVAGCYIGTDVTGMAPLGNGVGIFDEGHSLIGGGTAADRNVISGNGAGVVFLYASSSTVQGNFIGTDATGRGALGNDTGIQIVRSGQIAIGGTGDRFGNVISANSMHGIYLSELSSDVVVKGNLIGTNLAGKPTLGNGDSGIRCASRAAFNQIGGLQPGEGNLIAGNGGSGIALDACAYVTVAGNSILANTGHGVYLFADDESDLLGNIIRENGGDGVLVQETLGGVIGGAAAAERNVISDNDGTGVHLFYFTSGVMVENNLIERNGRYGVEISEASNNVIGSGNDIVANGLDGVSLSGSYRTAFNTIGGNSVRANGGNGVAIWYAQTTSVRENAIVNNGLNGVLVLGSGQEGSGNTFRQNGIGGNGLLGIDLGGDGVTHNDAGDGDVGANGLQNYPVLTAVSVSGGSVVISGMLDSLPNATFTLEFFANGMCDLSGYGEGETALGTVTVTTDAGGTADFAATLAAAVPPEQFVTATATDSAGNTSEFSRCLGVWSAPERIVALQTAVQQLVDNGDLRPEFGRGLIALLRQAETALAAGDEQAAIVNLWLFNHSMRRLLAHELVPAEAGQWLLDQGRIAVWQIRQAMARPLTAAAASSARPR